MVRGYHIEARGTHAAQISFVTSI